MILVFAAMRTEVDACLGWAACERQEELDGFPLFKLGDLVVCQTGLGRRARDAAEAALRLYSPSCVVSAGVAGGLAGGIAVGDVVVCQRIDHESHRSLDVDASIFSDEVAVRESLRIARELDLRVHKGASLTVDRVAWTATAKAEHHAWKGHAIVEMESYWVGEAAVAGDVPFVTVRTISDAAGDELPEMLNPVVREDGTFDQAGYVSYLREHPGAGAVLGLQADRMRLALSNLSRLMSALAPRLDSLARGSSGGLNKWSGK